MVHLNTQDIWGEELAFVKCQNRGNIFQTLFRMKPGVTYYALFGIAN